MIGKTVRGFSSIRQSEDLDRTAPQCGSMDQRISRMPVRRRGMRCICQVLIRALGKLFDFLIKPAHMTDMAKSNVIAVGDLASWKTEMQKSNDQALGPRKRSHS